MSIYVAMTFFAIACFILFHNFNFKTIDDMQPQESIKYLNAVSNRSTIVRESLLLITIITVRRHNNYLSRVVARLHQLINTTVLICNVDKEPEKHIEAIHLSRIYPLISKPPSKDINIFEKEKQDYSFCIKHSRKIHKSDIIILEDDAILEFNFLNILQTNLRVIKEKYPNFLYLKLYHPERLQGFLQPEPWRWFDWICLTLITTTISTVFMLFFGYYKKYLFFYMFSFYVVIIGILGRQNTVIFLKRYFNYYTLFTATECCFPGMLFSYESAARVVNFFDSVTCDHDWPKDIALYDYMIVKSETAFVIEPNLVYHIGLNSSLH